jgi:hypothetical protein
MQNEIKNQTKTILSKQDKFQSINEELDIEETY